MNFSNRNRPHFLKAAQQQEFDLVVIGGGITGCGIALDASLRGIKTLLLEKNDFGYGTSSRSTKLIHGGLRYLKQLELKLVRDVGRERAIVYRNARHVVLPERMLLPIVKNGSLGKQSSSLGLMVYDLLAGVKKSEQRVMLNKHFTLEAEPLLDESKVTGGGLYFEYRTDDARLVIELAKSAFKEGALLLNYAEVRSFVKSDSGKIAGLTVMDKTSDATFEVRAKYVVNAAGPWVDVLRKEDGSLSSKRLQLTKGVHIVFRHEQLPVKQAVYFDVADGRMIFAIPRNGITYVGTTDTVYNQDIDSPKANNQDVQYLLNAVNQMFPSVNLKKEDVVSSWAGLRPLIHEDGKSPSELSRKDEVIVSPSGLISIAGGKLTGYRLMAEKVTDSVALLLSKNFSKHTQKCVTKKYLLSGGNFATREEAKAYLKSLLPKFGALGLNENVATNLFHRYGSNTEKVLSYFVKTDSMQTDEMLLRAELNYCIEHEAVQMPEDFLIDRTGYLFFARNETATKIKLVVEQLTNVWQWNDEKKQKALQSIQQKYDDAVMFE